MPDWPLLSDSFCARRRASWSGAPPGASATTTRIVLFGKGCANAPEINASAATASSSPPRYDTLMGTPLKPVEHRRLRLAHGTAPLIDRQWSPYNDTDA